MAITKGTETIIAKSIEDGSFVAKRGSYTYEVVAEGRWNDALQYSESILVSFTISRGQRRIIEEKIIPQSVGGYFLLP